MRNLILGVVCLFTVALHAAESLPAPPDQGVITLQTAIGTHLQGYVAGPADATRGILILHDRWGLNDTVRSWVERFAAQGWRALAIDVFDGRISDQLWLATEIMNATDTEAVKVNVNAGVDYLRRQQAGRKVVTLGAGFGGWQSFQAAIARPDQVAATVVMYGALDASVDQVRTLQAPLLTLYARDDERIDANLVERYRQLLRKSLIVHRAYTLPAASGFMQPRHPAYDVAASEEAWRLVDDFLDSFVGS